MKTITFRFNEEHYQQVKKERIKQNLPVGKMTLWKKSLRKEAIPQSIIDRIQKYFDDNPPDKGDEEEED